MESPTQSKPIGTLDVDLQFLVEVLKQRPGDTVLHALRIVKDGLPEDAKLEYCRLSKEQRAVRLYISSSQFEFQGQEQLPVPEIEILFCDLPKVDLTIPAA